MKIIFLLLMIASCVALMVFVINCLLTKRRILDAFSRNNVYVYGKKGCGKDLLFQKVINCRKKKYFANISYGGDYNHIEVKDLELTPNTYENFIDGNVVKVNQEDYNYEDYDIYISESGIILPAQEDSKLNKLYPSLPISYALSRHLWNNNIHCNTQTLGRTYKKLREQADYFIRCVRTYKLPFILIIKVITYDKYESALNNVLPMKNNIFNKTQKALKSQFDATNGEIKSGFVVIRKSSIHYDTRAFKKVIFKGEE